jgi:hypothetical protein
MLCDRGSYVAFRQTVIAQCITECKGKEGQTWDGISEFNEQREELTSLDTRGLTINNIVPRKGGVNPDDRLGRRYYKPSLS